MSISKQTLHYSGPASGGTSSQEVDIYDDGQLVVHTNKAEGAKAYTFTVWGGSHTLSTVHRLDLAVISGPVTIIVDGKKKSIAKTGKLTLKPGAQFTLEAKGLAVLLGTPKPGPGLGDDDENKPPILI